jgi:hypothetical protein
MKPITVVGAGIQESHKFDFLSKLSHAVSVLDQNKQKTIGSIKSDPNDTVRVGLNP